jgi:hypothetical protein
MKTVIRLNDRLYEIRKVIEDFDLCSTTINYIEVRWDGGVTYDSEMMEIITEGAGCTSVSSVLYDHLVEEKK